MTDSMLILIIAEREAAIRAADAAAQAVLDAVTCADPATITRLIEEWRHTMALVRVWNS